jgi:hypothetical protein
LIAVVEDWKPKSTVLQSLLAGRALTPAPNKQAARAILRFGSAIRPPRPATRLCSPKDIIRARVAKAWRATFDNIRDEVRREWSFNNPTGTLDRADQRRVLRIVARHRLTAWA